MLFIFVSTLLIMLSVPLGVENSVDNVSQALVTIGVTIALAGSIAFRFLYVKPESWVEQQQPPLDKKAYLLLWLLPLVATIVMLPWLLTGFLATEGITIFGSLCLWVLVAYLALTLGLLLMLVFVLPLELIGKGIVHVLKGDTLKGSWYATYGLLMLSIIAFSIVAVFAIDVDRSFIPGAWKALLSALLGIPGSYEVINIGLLWMVRTLGLLIIALIAAVVSMKRQTLYSRKV